MSSRRRIARAAWMVAMAATLGSIVSLIVSLIMSGGNWGRYGLVTGLALAGFVCLIVAGAVTNR